ncbi:MAG: hypothetical protein VB095_03985 [Anaerovorax sp.]|nr:hypothetical protein [Anaerovorax sp.]
MQNSYLNQELSQLLYMPIGVLPASDDSMYCSLCYPEVYYKVQPFVMSACDQMNSFSRLMPSQELFDQVSDDIYMNVCTMYPDLEQYAACYDMKSSVETTQRGRDGYRNYRFRRRGLFRDFIDLLLLNELFRRGFGIL